LPASSAASLTRNVSRRDTPALVASLFEGELRVRLASNCEAWIQAGDWAFSSSGPSDFAIVYRDGVALSRSLSGTVEMQQWRAMIGIDVNVLPNRKIVVGSNKRIDVRPRATRKVQTLWGLCPDLKCRQLKASLKLVSYYTSYQVPSDQFSPSKGGASPERAAFRAVRFTLPPGLATFEDNGGTEITTLTDGDGVATVTIVGGDRGQGKIVGTMMPADSDGPSVVYIPYKRAIRIIPDSNRSWKKGLVALAIGGVALTCAFKCR